MATNPDDDLLKYLLGDNAPGEPPGPPEPNPAPEPSPAPVPPPDTTQFGTLTDTQGNPLGAGGKGGSATQTGGAPPPSQAPPVDTYGDPLFAGMKGKGGTATMGGNASGPNLPDPAANLTGQTVARAQPTADYLLQLLSSGMDPQEAIAQFNKRTGRTYGNEAWFYGPEVHGTPTIGLPGEYLSLENGVWKITKRSPEQGAVGGLPPGHHDTTGQQQQTQTTTGQTTLETLLAQLLGQQNQSNAFSDTLHTSVLDSINRYGTPPTSDSPEVAGPVNAFKAEAERSRNLEQEKMAERGHAQGLSQGALDAGVQNSYENLGRATGSMQASTLTTALTSQRDNLLRAQQLGAGILSAEEQRDLTAKLGAIDAMLRQTALSNANNLGIRSLDLQELGLNNQDQQFYDNFGLQGATTAANMDDFLLNAILNGM